MVPETPTPTLESAMYAGHLVLPGGRHLAAGRNCQDHAVTLLAGDAAVIAVADGASRVNGEPSSTETGAQLTAEIAAQAAMEAAARGVEAGEMRRRVAQRLVEQLSPLWRGLGPRAGRLLHCTLVLGVTTPAFTAVWCCGDGAWGARGAHLAPGPDGVLLPRARPVHGAEMWSDGQIWSVHGQAPALTQDGMTVARACRRGDANLAATALERVFFVEGPVHALYVATDGLDDEPQLRNALRGLRSAVSGERLGQWLERVADCDDLGIAWVAERRPSTLNF